MGAPLLPPTRPDLDAPIRWSLVWPGHSVSVWVWAIGIPAPDFAVSRDQVAQLFDFTIDEDIEGLFPADWVTGDERLELWSRTTAVSAARFADPASTRVNEFEGWLSRHQQLFVESFDEDVNNSLPTAGQLTQLCEVQQFASRLGVSRELCFSRMVVLDLVKVRSENLEQGRYTPTEFALKQKLVTVRLKRIPGRPPRTYHQVLLTQAGVALLEADVRALTAANRDGEVMGE